MIFILTNIKNLFEILQCFKHTELKEKSQKYDDG